MLRPRVVELVIDELIPAPVERCDLPGIVLVDDVVVGHRQCVLEAEGDLLPPGPRLADITVVSLTGGAA